MKVLISQVNFVLLFSLFLVSVGLGVYLVRRVIIKNREDRRKAEDAIRECENRYKTLFENTTDPLFVISADGTLVDCNAAAESFFERNRQELVTTNFNTIINMDVPDKEEILQKGKTIEIECQIQGQTKFLNLTLTPCLSNGEKILFGLGKNITERRIAEEKIRYLAYHDNQTGLANRLSLLEYLNKCLKEAKKQGSIVGVLFLDLDRFKIINDTLGHNIGDRLLQAVANRLKRCIRVSDMVARFGGDEFTIVLTQLNRLDDCINVSRKILSQFQKPLRVGRQEFYISPSIGIASFPKDGSDVEALLKNADIAMYKAKVKGRQSVMMYSPSMNRMNLDEMELENPLYKALETGQVSVDYQPQIQVSTE